jgi:serine/threonine protein kinase
VDGCGCRLCSGATIGDYYSFTPTLLHAGESFISHTTFHNSVCVQVWQWPELLPDEPISNALSSIILRLMAKNKEDRYQSSSGVKADLEICLTALQAPPGTIITKPLELRGRDTTSLLQVCRTITS